MKNNRKLTWNKILAIVFLISLVILSVRIVPPLYTWNNENNKLQQPRTFHMMFSYNLNEIPYTVGNETYDIVIDLTLNYPHGTLIVDDPVSIHGIAIIKPSINQKVKGSITIWFQNAQAYPETQDEKGITKGQDLILSKKQDNNTLVGNTTIVWVLEGTYSPKMIMIYTNETGTHIISTDVSPDVAVTVYPKEKLAQIVTNKVSIILAIAFYFLAIIGTISISLSLWDRKPKTQNEKNNSKYEDDTTKIKHNEKKKRER